MKNLWRTSLLNSLGTLVYIIIVALLIQNGEKLFGPMTNLGGPIAFLLLFTVSALIVGVLVLGKPLMLYLDGKKKEAIQLLGLTISFLAFFTLIALIVQAFI